MVYKLGMIEATPIKAIAEEIVCASGSYVLFGVSLSPVLAIMPTAESIEGLQMSAAFGKTPH